jgi:nucleoside-diphosphate-sugar epimerase
MVVSVAVLITGGTGFLGSHLARLLVVEKGMTDVVLFDHNPVLDRIADVADDVTVIEGDIRDLDQLMAAMSKYDIDRVVHYAFMSGTNHPERTVPYVQLTCVGTVNVFEAARLNGVKRIVNPSTLGRWSAPYDQEKSEDAPRPQSLYGATKVWTEHLAHVYNEQHGMEILSLIVPATMGRGRLEKGSFAAGLMGDQITHFMAYPELAARGNAVTMPPNDQLTEVCYAADMAEAFWCALSAPRPQHEVFSLTAERRRCGDMTEAMRQLLPSATIEVSAEPLWVGPLLSNKRLVEELGFRPRYTLETALAAYMDDVHRAAVR